MQTTETGADVGAIRDEWIDRLGRLIGDVDTWARDLDWSTRRIDKRMEDATIGRYKAPGLLMQKGFTRILLDPISRTTPGSEGVVDIYLMPALDDIASLYFYDGRWNVHYRLPNDETVTSIRNPMAMPLTSETFAKVLEGLAQHAA